MTYFYEMAKREPMFESPRDAQRLILDPPPYPPCTTPSCPVCAHVQQQATKAAAASEAKAQQRQPRASEAKAEHVASEPKDPAARPPSESKQSESTLSNGAAASESKTTTGTESSRELSSSEPSEPSESTAPTAPTAPTGARSKGSRDKPVAEGCRALVVFQEPDPRMKWLQEEVRHVVVCRRRLKITQITARNKAGTGAVMWDAAVVLAKYLERHVGREGLARKSVIELGAGLGLVSAVSSLLGARTYATDGDPRVLARLRMNLEENTKNQTDYPASVQQYRWGDEKADVVARAPYDYILASDILYQVESLGYLVKSLRDLSSQHSVILMSYKLRKEGLDGFFTMVDKWFAVEEISQTNIVSRFRNCGIHLIKMTRRHRDRAEWLDR